MFSAFQKSAFQNNAFQTEVVDTTLQTVLAPYKSGPAFTRKRYREFLEAEAAAKEAERKAAALKEEKARLAAEAAAQAAREAILAAQTQDRLEWEQLRDVRAIERSLAAFNAAQSRAELSKATAALSAVARIARARIEDDEDEERALKLLLLSE